MKSEPYTPSAAPSGNMGLKLFLAWALVGIPLVWGVWETLLNALKLFE
jgi:hypothetical protein